MSGPRMWRTQELAPKSYHKGGSLFAHALEVVLLIKHGCDMGQHCSSEVLSQLKNVIMFAHQMLTDYSQLISCCNHKMLLQLANMWSYLCVRFT